MDRLYRTVVQLEESKRFILDGDVERLRLALILLDNAGEAIMSRFIDEEFSHAGAYARMLEKFPDGPLDIKGEALRRDIEAKVIPPRRQNKIERSFNEKLTFLSNDCRFLPSPTARALRHLHRYRNEAQHHDRTREGSIRPAVLLLFDIIVDLLVSLNTGTTWASYEDYRWLIRYQSDASSPAGGDDGLLVRIATGLRSKLHLDIAGIRRALVAHLTARLGTMNNELKFTAKNWFGPDLKHALKVIQFYLQHPKCDWKDFKPSYNLDSFAKWRDATEKLNSMDKLVMFGEFATIEDELEPLEEMIGEVSSEIDYQIQMEIDLRRGK